MRAHLRPEEQIEFLNAFHVSGVQIVDLPAVIRFFEELWEPSFPLGHLRG